MKYIIISLLSLFLISTAAAGEIQTEKRRIDTIVKSVWRFKSDTWFTWSCQFLWTPTTLEAIVLAKSANESSYWTAGKWKRYNNRWNLKYARVKKLPKQTAGTRVHGDGWQYYIYERPEQGIYDMAARTARASNNTCNFTYNTAAYYLLGHKPKNAKERKKVNMYVWDLKSVVDAVNAKKPLFTVDTVEVQEKWNFINS